MLLDRENDPFILGNKFWTVMLRSEALLRSESYKSDLKTSTRPEIIDLKWLMMFSLLCIFSCGKGLSFSKFAPTTACGWPKFCSVVLSASQYITPQYANSAMAVLVFPVARVFKYVKLTSSVKDCESMVLLNCPNHSCHCKGSPLYADKFHWGKGSFILQVIASANGFIKTAEFKERSKGVGFGG